MNPVAYQVILTVAITMFCLSNIWLLFSFLRQREERALEKMEIFLREILNEKAYFEMDRAVERGIKKFSFNKEPLIINLYITNNLIHCDMELVLFKGLKRKELLYFSYDRHEKTFTEYLKQNGYIETKPKYSVYQLLLTTFSKKVVTTKWRPRTER